MGRREWLFYTKDSLSFWDELDEVCLFAFLPYLYETNYLLLFALKHELNRAKPIRILPVLVLDEIQDA